jgi:hypothetical protein
MQLPSEVYFRLKLKAEELKLPVAKLAHKIIKESLCEAKQ